MIYGYAQFWCFIKKSGILGRSLNVFILLIRLRPIFLSYRNQLTDFCCKSIDWFLLEDNIGFKKVKSTLIQIRKSFNISLFTKNSIPQILHYNDFHFFEICAIEICNIFNYKNREKKQNTFKSSLLFKQNSNSTGT